jgi:periplasmic protein TonB
VRKRSTGSTKVPFHNLSWASKLPVYGVFHTFLGDGVLPLNTMAPLTKDSLEVAGPATEVAAPRPAAQPKAAAAAGHLRSDALSLEVPVKVHGSRVNDAVQGAAPRTEPFEEQTTTMIVFPHGCVIRMSTAVNVGQMLVVTNLKTRQDAICRTVKVRTFTNMQSYVEVEFTHKQDGYWGAQFSTNGPVAASVVAPQTLPSSSSSTTASIPAPPTPVVSAPVEKQAYTPAVAPAEPAVATGQKPSVAPAPSSVPPVAQPSAQMVAPPVVSASQVAPLPPPTFVPPAPPPPFVAPFAQAPYVAPPPAPPATKQASSFVWIGTQEEVQPAASATVITKPGAPSLSSRPVAPVRQAPSLELPKTEFPKIAASIEELSAAAESAPVLALTMSELRGDEPTAAVNVSGESVHMATLEQLPSLEEKPAESSRAVFGSLSGGSFGASRTASPEALGSRLDSALSSPDDSQSPGRSNNWILIAVCLGVLFACVAGGVLYFHSQSNGGGSNVSSSARPQSTPQSQEVSAEQSALQNSAPGKAVSGPVATAIPSGTPAITVSAGAANSTIPPAKTNSAVRQTVSKIASMMNGAVVEHPVTAQRLDASAPDAAPSVDAAPAGGSSVGNALGGVVSSVNIAAPAAPDIRPEGHVVIGGKVAEPRLVYRALPVYPANAKQAGISGDVVVKTTIDQKGSVVDMHVVSGPLMLRQAALDALHRWKFEPSKLDGQPIAVEMLVTIRFSR